MDILTEKTNLTILFFLQAEKQLQMSLGLGKFKKKIKHQSVFCYDIYFADTLDGKFLKSCGRKYFISTLKVLNFKTIEFCFFIF